MRRLRMFMVAAGLIACAFVACNYNWLMQPETGAGKFHVISKIEPRDLYQWDGQTPPPHPQPRPAPAPLPAPKRAVTPVADLHLVKEVTDANFEREVLGCWVTQTMLIWIDRPERAAVFDQDAAMMERMAESSQGVIKFVRIDLSKVTKDGPIDQTLNLAGGRGLIFTIMRCCGEGKPNFQELWLKGIKGPGEPPDALVPQDVIGMLLSFTPPEKPAWQHSHRLSPLQFEGCR